jgi:hypothetical protein
MTSAQVSALQFLQDREPAIKSANGGRAGTALIAADVWASSGLLAGDSPGVGDAADTDDFS